MYDIILLENGLMFINSEEIEHLLMIFERNTSIIKNVH